MATGPGGIREDHFFAFLRAVDFFAAFLAVFFAFFLALRLAAILSVLVRVSWGKTGTGLTGVDHQIPAEISDRQTSVEN